jgi:hypothetical protein
MVSRSIPNCKLNMVLWTVFRPWLDFSAPVPDTAPAGTGLGVFPTHEAEDRADIIVDA